MQIVRMRSKNTPATGKMGGSLAQLINARRPRAASSHCIPVVLHMKQELGEYTKSLADWLLL